MGRDGYKFGDKIRRFSAMSIKACYRSVCNHPFLVGMVCFLIFLYRSFPFLFSLLVSASPVLVSTAILLGVLLSFGQPNIPEIDKEEKITHESAPLKTEVAKDTTLVERDQSFTVERYVGKERDVVEDGYGETRLRKSLVSEIEEDNTSVDDRPFIDESSREIKFEKRAVEELEREFYPESEKNGEVREEKPIIEALTDGEVIQNEKVADKNLEVEDDRFRKEIVEAEKEDPIDITSPVSPWKPLRPEDDDDDANDGDESLDSGSDGAESSSPDASMADIIPILDELHPLLDSEAPQPVHMSREVGSDAASEGPNGSTDDGDESDVDTEDPAEEGEEDNDDDDDDEEGETRGDKEDGSKSAIKWTEDDEKNLIDLGSLELERNLRLENLIARRRARKTSRFITEKNLIDLDGADIPFNIPPITTKRNPFDVPYDSYDDLGPIPGSAPSILLPRRNPFDLPYDPNEEKPDLKADSFQEEFSGFHQKECMFRRHESFTAGPSIFGLPKQERQDVKLRPYFVPERLASEGTSYPSFERQLSEVSESKVSSVPDTESVSSAAEEDKKLNEQDVSEQNEVMSNADHSSVRDENRSQSSEEVGSVDIEQAEKRDVHHDVVEITLGDMETHHEIESSLSEAVATNLVELDSCLVNSRRDLVEGDYSLRSSLSSLSGVDEKFTDMKTVASTSLEPGDHVEDSRLSPKPSLEESEFHFTSVGPDDQQHREPVYDSSPPPVAKFLSFSSTSSDYQLETDEMRSPPARVDLTEKGSEICYEGTKKNAFDFEEVHAASSLHTMDETESISREVVEKNKHDFSEAGLSKIDTRFDGQNGFMVSESVLQNVSVNASSSSSKKEGDFDLDQDQVHLSSVNNEMLGRVHQEVNGTSDFSHSSHKLAYQDSHMPETEKKQASMLAERIPMLEPSLSSLDVDHLEKNGMDGSVAEGTSRPGKINLSKQIQTFYSFDTDVFVCDHEHVDKELSSSASFISSGDLTLSANEQQLPLAAKQVSDGHSNLFSSEVQHPEVYSLGKEDVLQFRSDQAQSSNSDEKIDSHVYQNMDVKVVSVDSNQYAHSKENYQSKLEKRLSWSDKSVVEPFISDNLEHQETSTSLIGSADGVNSTSNANLQEIHDPDNRILANLSQLTSDLMSSPLGSPEYKSPSAGDDMSVEILDGIVYEDCSCGSEPLACSEEHDSHVADGNIHEEPDEIKEIDEGLLSELDTIGDFSVKEVVGESMDDQLLSEGRNFGNPEFGFSLEDSTLKEKNMELPALEVRSVEDIDSAFRQIHEGADVEEVILPSMVEDQLAADKLKDAVDVKSELPVVEARSLEDMHIVLKQVLESHVDELLKPSGSMDEASEQGVNYSHQIMSEFPVVEARSVDDMHTVLKQESEGNMGGLPEVEANNHVVVESELPIVEARSLEDIHITMEQVAAGKLDELPKFLEKDTPAGVEAKNEVSRKDIESSNAESNIKESTPPIDEQKLGSEETSEILSLSKSDGSKEKGKSVRSSSSSSASSDSSSSDSD